MYVIVRNDGMYVARPGSQYSYTDKLQFARVYRARGDAILDSCPENEHVESVADILGFSW